MDWPIGRRASFDEHGVVEYLDAHAPVEWWVCFRVDEPWTWKVMTNQFTGSCRHCGAAIVYRVSGLSPTNAGVQRICTHCAERIIEAER